MLWTVINEVEIRDRWFSDYNFLLLSPLPLLSLVAAFFLWKELSAHKPHQDHSRESRPFWCASALFLLGFAGLVVGLLPYLIPRQLTFMDAASPDSSLLFLLPGVCIFVPLICAYTIWGYRVFAGKVEDYQEGY
ncbi:cytochrome d ubiquinol oxidase subunit II [Marinomonas sp. 5E14-1]|uniref:cytochrome d ubiquinol oxidase subunit II n=1 Tax=Marinomonas sp. 5E14-1 TaxID=3153922 RepID=UPI003266F9CD